MLFANAEGACTHVNRRWTELTGSEAAQNRGSGWLERIHEEDRERWRAEWEACVGAPHELTSRVRIRKPDGQVKLVSVAVMPLQDGATGAGFVLTVEEAEHAEKSEAEALHARKMEAVGRLASGLAHDFANLLTLISGYSEIVLNRLSVSDPLRGEVDEIRKAANRGSGLTRQLLAFSRRNAVEAQVIDLNALVSEMQKMLRGMIGEHIELETNLSAELGGVKGDPGQIEQVIMNLVINARDAMPRGGKITIRSSEVNLDGNDERVKLGLKAGPYVMLQVEDTGQGMDQQILEHLFEPFFTTKNQGTGLGLATVYGIVRQCRGDVFVHSEPAKGSRFTVLLPRVETQTGAGMAESARGTTAQPRGGGFGSETILLVEDEEGVRRLLKHLLGKQGYQVIEAANGPEAMVLFQQNQPIHLLLTDIVMPRMSGRELAERLVKLQPGLKVIFMSGYTDEAVIGTGEAYPGALFLQKPLRPEVLLARVREVLDSAGAREAAPGGGAAQFVRTGL